MAVSVLSRSHYHVLPRDMPIYYPTPALSANSAKRKKELSPPPSEVIDLCTPPPTAQQAYFPSYEASGVFSGYPSYTSTSSSGNYDPLGGQQPGDDRVAKRRRVDGQASGAINPQTATAASCDDAEGHFKCTPKSSLGDRNRYTIIDVIGQGTFGKVVRAWDNVRQRSVAVKIIRAIQKYRDASAIELRVLQALRKADPQNRQRCIQLLESFEHRNHVCMVFDLLSKSIYDYMKENQFHPFPLAQVQSFAAQMLHAVSYMHQQNLIHTDLKPENLMLLSAEFKLQPSNKFPNGIRKELTNTDIMLIDFGSATFDTEYHSTIVSTRHYRAPEIILSMGWSFPCDMWSIGCLLIEFYTGEALFQTHDNLEHLAMMETILGPFPTRLVNGLGAVPRKFFGKGSRVDFPNAQVSRSSRKFVKGLKPLTEIIRPEDSLFLDFVRRLLVYEPSKRMTSAQALQHPFVQGYGRR